MSVYWVRFQGDSVAGAMKAIADALQQDNRETAPEADAAASSVSAPPSIDGDEYLQTNLHMMQQLWSVDPLRVELPSDQRLLTRLRVHLQHFIRRVTRWYVIFPWLQANEFHGATTRVVESLLVRQQTLQQELNEYRYRLQAIEQQVHLLRNELAMSRQHLMEVRQQLAVYQSKSE
ncbi:hypothetical protein [Chloroflexus sp.]|uniref:hypothetical protein n=1 Tax=Chloroflexus sp. TaxID=1904827 RepID=UPI003C7405AE